MTHAAFADLINTLMVSGVPHAVSLLGTRVPGVLSISTASISPHAGWVGVGETLVAISGLIEGSNSGLSRLIPGPVFSSLYFSSVSLASGPVPLEIGGALSDALDFPPWTGTVVKFAGLCTFLIGVMAWLSSLGYRRRSWGRHIALSGAALTVVGFAFDTFVELLKYVLAG